MTTTASHPLARLYWLALGTFAIGTEGFMIAPLLPDLARDLSVSLVSAGQLVTVFALTYALSSPVLTALTGDIDRRRLLIASMLAFAAANFVAWSASGYPALLAARILLAVAAGLYVPNANALASAIVEPSRRGGDVLQDEATREESRSGRPMFGDKFPSPLEEEENDSFRD